MRVLVALVVLAGALVGCTAGPGPTTLTVLASSELADLGPVLADLRRETGVELKPDYRGTVRASEDVARGTGHDLAWLSSARYLKLRGGDLPLATSMMLSPLVIGVKAGKAAALRGGQASWADIAALAGSGGLKYLMADPRATGSGLAALIGVATAAAGTGAALRTEDVRCDKLQGFLVGRAVVSSAEDVAEDYVRRQDEVDAVLTYESTVLSLNASGRLREPLEVVYPRDGIVLADYPLMLLKPEKRAAYDRVVAWLGAEPAQRALMERTFRRPVDPRLPRTDPLRTPLGTALYFPGTQQVVDSLLAAYDRAGKGSRVVFVLDYSTSMAGARIEGLRSAFAALSGFDRFHLGETVTVVRFAGEVLASHTVTIRGPADVDALRDLLAANDLRDGTAIWSALDHAYREAGDGTVVLMTDGENNAGVGVEEFLAAWPKPAAPTYAVRFGEADPVELARVADVSGGRVVDAAEGALAEAVKEIRGCR
ncbi:substrate-binding domain-containing protein [Actinosynnema sp. CS-041913]|uniref:vWA domain-containing protein n=1 Tax=Actinosynnema sp. CS-041913 TaxID=3239917 RepID=UPI003D8A8A44